MVYIIGKWLMVLLFCVHRWKWSAPRCKFPGQNSGCFYQLQTFQWVTVSKVSQSLCWIVVLFLVAKVIGAFLCQTFCVSIPQQTNFTVLFLHFSLLKVHMQLKEFSVFIDVERLEAGKFDNNLLNSIRQARNFLLVLTPNALDRCIGDNECKDWVHRVSWWINTVAQIVLIKITKYTNYTLFYMCILPMVVFHSHANSIDCPDLCTAFEQGLSTGTSILLVPLHKGTSNTHNIPVYNIAFDSWNNKLFIQYSSFFFAGNCGSTWIWLQHHSHHWQLPVAWPRGASRRHESRVLLQWSQVRLYRQLVFIIMNEDISWQSDVKSDTMICWPVAEVLV